MDSSEVDGPSINDKGIKRVQSIVGGVLFYGREVDNKVLLALNNIGTQHTAATESTNESINHLLDYLVTYPNDGIVYRARKMVLVANLDADFHNKYKGQIRAGSHVFLVEDEPIPRWNGTILTIARVIKFVMSS